MLNYSMGGDDMSVKDEIMSDESFRRYPYVDTTGNLTIGHGINLNAGISESESEMIVDARIARIEKDLDRELPFWKTLSQPRRDVLINMAYNLGFDGLMNFTKTLRHIKAGDYDQAAKEMLNSLWAKQVKGRAVRLADRMRRG